MDVSALDGTNGFRLDGEAQSGFSGLWVSAAGDINADGFGDILIGSPGQYSKRGASHLVYGDASGFAPTIELAFLNGADGFEMSGELTEDYSGHSVLGAGDVNGDGLDDILISAPRRDNAGFNAGACYLVFGTTSGFAGTVFLSSLNGVPGFEIGGEWSQAFAGGTISAGDVNGDGLNDIVIGSSGLSGYGIAPGSTHVIFGTTAGFAPNLNLGTLSGPDGFEIVGETSHDRFGRSVCAAGDINGDGYDDLVIGAYWSNVNANKAGSAYVVFGQPSVPSATFEVSSLNGANGFQINGEAAIDYTGYVVSMGDFNGDGYDDMLMGALARDINGANAGAAYVVFGQASGFGANLNLFTLNGTDGFEINGETAGDRFGVCVSVAGDVNGDGYDDILVGADFRNSRDGAAYVIFGKASGFAANLDVSSLDGTNGFRINGDGGRFGQFVSGAGDVNGDGFDDIIVGALNFFDGANSVGASYVVFGGDFTGAVDATGTAGSDSLTGDESANVYVVGLGDDTLDGAGGADVLKGGTGNDWLTGGAGNDHLFGGLGFDIVSYRFDSAAVSVDLRTGRASGASAGADLLDEIEGIAGSTFGDTLNGAGESELLSGAEGNDTITGGAGGDKLDGGSGNDVLDGGMGSDTVIGGAGEDLFADATGHDTLDGGDADDTFLVNYYGGVSVTAAGGAGRDAYVLNPDTPDYNYTITDFQTGPGGDQIDISPILDAAGAIGAYNGQNPFTGGFVRLVPSGSNTLVQWDLDGPAGGYSYVTGLTLLNVTPNSVSREDNFVGLLVGNKSANTLGGSAENDYLLGLGGNDSLNGAAGDDQLYGGTGLDTMRGGAGSDTFHVDNGGDKVVEVSNKPGTLLLPGADADGLAGVGGIVDTVVAAIDFSLEELRFVENVELLGAATDATGNALANVLTGNALSNLLEGVAGNDSLSGAAGNDTLDGGLGDDALDGGAGRDSVNGGAGADMLVWSSTDSFDGGADTDTLVVAAGSNLNLTATGNTRILNIEQIDLTAPGDNSLTLNVSDLLDISSTTNTLKVLGNAGDSVDIVGTFTVRGVSGDFRTYKVGTGTLLVDTDIVVA
jgi:Ca2+-binding RTX toxin-like protein